MSHFSGYQPQPPSQTSTCRQLCQVSTQVLSRHDCQSAPCYCFLLRCLHSAAAEPHTVTGQTILLRMCHSLPAMIACRAGATGKRPGRAAHRCTGAAHEAGAGSRPGRLSSCCLTPPNPSCCQPGQAAVSGRHLGQDHCDSAAH